MRITKAAPVTTLMPGIIMAADRSTILPAFYPVTFATIHLDFDKEISPFL